MTSYPVGKWLILSLSKNSLFGYFSGYTYISLFHCLKVKWNESGSVVSNFLRPQELYSPWNSLGQNTGVGSLSLLQWIFRAQESNQGLPHCRRILYQLSYEGSPIWLHQSNRFLVEDSSAWSDAKSGQWGISIRYCLFVCLATLSLGCCKGFSFSCGEWGLLFSCRTQISDCRDFSCC